MQRARPAPRGPAEVDPGAQAAEQGGPSAEEMQRREAEMARLREQRAAWMAEQRRRLSQRLDTVIDQLPEPPMFGAEPPAPTERAPWGGPRAGAAARGYPRTEMPGGYPGYGWGPGYAPGPGYGPAPYGGYGYPSYGR